MKPSQADGPTPDECVLLEVFRDILVKEDARRPMDRKSLPPMAEMPALTRQLHEECVRECLKAGYMQTAAELFATGYVRGAARRNSRLDLPGEVARQVRGASRRDRRAREQAHEVSRRRCHRTSERTPAHGQHRRRSPRRRIAPPLLTSSRRTGAGLPMDRRRAAHGPAPGCPWTGAGLSRIGLRPRLFRDPKNPLRLPSPFPSDANGRSREPSPAGPASRLRCMLRRKNGCGSRSRLRALQAFRSVR